MTLLVLDTAQGLCSVALGREGRVIASRSEPMTRGHQERLPVLVKAVLTEAGLPASDLAVVAATRGPGSFTGLRVGLAFAQGLAAATGARPIGLSSLDALAVQARLARPDDPAPIAAVMDARRGQVYLALWGPRGIGGDVDPALERSLLHAAGAMTIGDAATLLNASRPPGRVIGSGALLVGHGWQEAWGADGPDPEALVQLATIQGDRTDSVGLEPLYLRTPDATPPTRLPGQPRPDRL
ncbi:tRNA (adenosine(37)-N6)-threonylcarbamoyltransferase complex dimerization subunit type 1 TsaB [Brevundimonas sp.]|uniref:tRNA (adenosine(37)-N6)-threonylcarbamoyltransferase complex dimerization subunit type 1 TsaB n=1 Tax=Brevundimonas sp. TaxID=1871086 RepID=UPI001D906CE7|nr:tRNA (adenosine(37)-N6)-threonylcarbamoyltransferase complex dimerization subunit type 1 TsaB [Brevundimonas sp.]MBL0948123.1 tRNA (adenosine(37)-N6)-threonylcarbamoyltransferase complex dimerization subunit type 1 TsaB [Brevundimonas sp.]